MPKKKASKKLKGHKIEGSVNVKGGGVAPKDAKVHVGDGVYEQPVCNVGYKVGATKNLGDYNSVRVDVSLFMPCYPSEINDVYSTARDWCEERLEEEMDRIHKDLS